MHFCEMWMIYQGGSTMNIYAQWTTELNCTRRRPEWTCLHIGFFWMNSTTHSTFCCTRSRVNSRRPVSKLESSLIFGGSHSSTLIIRGTIRIVNCYRTMLYIYYSNTLCYCTINVLRVKCYWFMKRQLMTVTF